MVARSNGRNHCYDRHNSYICHFRRTHLRQHGRHHRVRNLLGNIRRADRERFTCGIRRLSRIVCQLYNGTYSRHHLLCPCIRHSCIGYSVWNGTPLYHRGRRRRRRQRGRDATTDLSLARRQYAGSNKLYHKQRQLSGRPRLLSQYGVVSCTGQRGGERCRDGLPGRGVHVP